MNIVRFTPAPLRPPTPAPDEGAETHLMLIDPALLGYYVAEVDRLNAKVVRLKAALRRKEPNKRVRELRDEDAGLPEKKVVNR